MLSAFHSMRTAIDNIFMPDRPIAMSLRLEALISEYVCYSAQHSAPVGQCSIGLFISVALVRHLEPGVEGGHRCFEDSDGLEGTRTTPGSDHAEDGHGHAGFFC